MSQAAMELRLRQAFDLWQFWRYLRQFRLVAPMSESAANERELTK